MDEKLNGPAKKGSPIAAPTATGAAAAAAPGQVAPMQSQAASTRAQEPKSAGRKKKGSDASKSSARFFTGKVADGEIPQLENEYESEAKAIAASYKLDRPFYRLEAFGAQEVPADDGVKLVKVPVSVTKG
jgi:hypothetical protein